MTPFISVFCAIFACITWAVADTGPFFTELTHRASSTSSISIAWRLSPEHEDDVIEYVIEWSKFNSGAVAHSFPLPATPRTYEVRDLVNNADYDICVSVSKLANTSALYHNETVDIRVCNQFCTIPLIRTDSLVVLLVAVGFVLLMVLTGYLCWRCAKARLERTNADEEPSESDANAGGYQPIEESTSEKDAFLAPPKSHVIRRPRSTIEDEDIPYITPPWNEMGEDDSEKRPTTNNSK